MHLLKVQSEGLATGIDVDQLFEYYMESIMLSHTGYPEFEDIFSNYMIGTMNSTGASYQRDVESLYHRRNIEDHFDMDADDSDPYSERALLLEDLGRLQWSFQHHGKVMKPCTRSVW